MAFNSNYTVFCICDLIIHDIGKLYELSWGILP